MVTLRILLFAVLLLSIFSNVTRASQQPVRLSAFPSYVPSQCTELTPGMLLPQPVTSCFVVRQAGATPYISGNVNIISGGALYFVEDPGKSIDFRVKSLLIEQGGLLQAGSEENPFGQSEGTLVIGLYGMDLSNQGQPGAPKGIQCQTNPDSKTGQRCFTDQRDPKNPDNPPFYCTGNITAMDDPCASTVAPTDNPDNALLQSYGNLNFDPTPFGYKVLAVSYGGSLRLFGHKGVMALPLPNSGSINAGGHCDVPTAAQSTLDRAEMEAWASLSGSSWVRLQASKNMQNPAQTLLTLDGLMTDWALGDQIIIGTTDWYPSHSEIRQIQDIKTVSTGTGMRTQIAIDQLDYPHFSEIFDTTQLEQQFSASYTNPVNRKAADLRAVVGLLTRSIQIRSLGETANDEFPKLNSNQCTYANIEPKCYFGGHTIARQGFQEVSIQGVEFKQMGQGGRIGHYPVHFHLAKSTAYTNGKAFIKDSAVWDSMTRFVTVHGTHEVEVSRNVGAYSVGHGFYIEDGSEIENRFCYNLGVSARGALEEYYTAQAKIDPIPLTARYIPPILDGSSPTPELQPSPSLVTGSDTYMPVMFWMMNAYNEFVGNMAVGVHGFGSCYWLLGSGVSGPSHSAISFDGFADYNLAGAFQAPLLRFRGNGCTTAALALPASAELSPAGLGEAINTGFTAVKNPYITNNDGSPKPVSELQGKYDRPAVVGNFQPIQPDAGTTNCSDTGTNEAILDKNKASCVTTLVDRFTTSFNWAEVNFGSVWLRPWYYLFLNGAMTDQLFGGLTFVSAGSWIQAPPGYFTLAKNNLFVGVTQHGGSQYAQRSGPIFEVTKSNNLSNYEPCNQGGKTTCNLETEGTGYWRGSIQPKRLINIYDGPHFADGNTFLNIGSWECDPQPCKNGACTLPFELPCGIYSSTLQPQSLTSVDKMVVIDAGVGWKQPNGFYYPPAFTYRGHAFFKDLPQGLPDPDPANPLNQCFSFGPENQYMNPEERLGGCRHNVIDRTRNYIQGNMLALNASEPSHITPELNNLPVTTIDFSTILIDLDGSLTGAEGNLEGVNHPVPATSVSRNPFFDAPAQSPECLAFGVQTSPYEFVTTALARLKNTPTSSQANAINPVTGSGWSATPMVAIYRQWQLADDPQTCGQICDEQDPTQYGCTRGTFMGGSSIGQASYLTMTEPPGLTDSQPGALYYIDTSSAQQSLACLNQKTGPMQAAQFTANESYVLYNLFARIDARSSYQLYVGGAQTLDDINGRYVRVTPHLAETGSEDSKVIDACDPRSASATWCKGMPIPEITNGVLTVTLNHAQIGNQFDISAREDYARCVPRDLCYFDQAANQCQRCTDSNPDCIRQGDFLAEDIAAMNHIDATGKAPLDDICQDWVSFVGGATRATPNDITLADCPAGGCLGFAFTLPSDFVGNMKYAQLGDKLANCFLESAWAGNALNQRSVNGQPADPFCGAPRAQKSTDFCADPVGDIPVSNSAFEPAAQNTQ